MIDYLKTFFDEKDLPQVDWELTDGNGVTNWIGNDVVIEAIGNAPISEQNAISDMIRRIDFANGDVNLFLRHLAQALVNGNG